MRVIDQEGEQAGVMSIASALALAAEAGMDLVEVAPNAEPPVCRVMDFGKYLFEKNKKANEAKKKTKQMQIKEIKFRPNTDIGDYKIKMRNINRFLEDGDKVKVTLRYRGREMQHQDLGRALLERIRDDLEGVATVEQFPKMEGRQLTMVMAAVKKEK